MTPLLRGSRRRRVRQRVHSPAYATLNGSSNGQVTDLSEIVDINEEGMVIQASSALEAQRSVSLCLDLTATSARIQTSGEVVWADRSGRVGIRFPQMPDDALRQLKEWLFVNLLVACVNYRAEHLSANQLSEVATRSGPEKPTENSALVNWMRRELEPTVPADYTSILTALAAVKREVDSLGADLDAALQLLAERALAFTQATGAAIALTQGSEMICRASAGQDAPSLGARFSVGSGFSGECVRTGRMLSCEDAEVDPIVDRETCRALGIRSMLAVPIRWEDAVIGLIEVFSPEPYAFSSSGPIALERLAEFASSAVYRAGAREFDSRQLNSQRPDSREPVALYSTSTKPLGQAAPALSLDDEFPVETPPHRRFSPTRKILMAAAVATVILAGAWLSLPGDFHRATSILTPQSVSMPSITPPAPPAPADSFEGMRKLAEQGDATAQFSVGAHYATGEDTAQDYAEAVRWFTMAAEQGHVVSQATLGAYYWAGRGVPQDLVKAYFWSVLAQTGGDEASKYRVAHLASRMTRAQITSAQQQADEWIKGHQTLSQNATANR